MAGHSDFRSLIFVACILGSVQAFAFSGFHAAQQSLTRRNGPLGPRAKAVSSLRMNSEDWTAAQDPATGQTYWYNSVTQESSWEAPAQSEAERGMASYGPRMGRLMEVPESQKKNSFRGGKDGLMEAMNPIKPGVVWYKEPSLLAFFGFKIGIVLYAIFVGFHNQYAGDFGPFITFHDGQVDFGQASREWARLHGSSAPVPPLPKQ